jgi:hypothetical protein
MPLYERLCGRDEAGNASLLKQPDGHLFPSLLGEVARGRLTGAQARAILETNLGEAISAGEATEATTLLGTISGSATAKLLRAKEIEDVLNLAHMRVAGYDRPSLVSARLGV